MKVIKFGGSSVASANQLKKVLAIVKEDPERRFVVVSAPGKRHSQDKKVTDLLISYYQAVVAHQETADIVTEIAARYGDIAAELEMKNDIVKLILAELKKLSENYDASNAYSMDAFLAAGENLNAQLVASYFQHEGIQARYTNPKELGIIVTDEPQNARILTESYNKIYQWHDSPEILVIPGFFGYTKDGQVCTFSRGGSDVTGSIVAAGMKADLYENFTDVDGIFAANPKYVHKPEMIDTLTYREMRELSYAGFTVLHDEALMPSFHAKTPVVIKNTNNPSAKGTIIKDSDKSTHNKVVGIASDHGFCVITIGKYLLNREIGFALRILKILADFQISFEHMPSGIDDISIVLRESQLTPEIEKLILSRIQNEIKPDQLTVEHDLSVLALVGEGMKEHPGIAAESTAALARKNVNLRMISQGADERSIIFVISREQERLAVRSVYYTFFN